MVDQKRRTLALQCCSTTAIVLTEARSIARAVVFLHRFPFVLRIFTEIYFEDLSATRVYSLWRSRRKKSPFSVVLSFLSLACFFFHRE